MLADDAAKTANAEQQVPSLVPRGSLIPLEYLEKPSIDVDAVMKDEHGNDLFDLDIDSLEDKPWRKPGANQADYFNYGMNELAWKNYVLEQRRLRESENAEMNPWAVSTVDSLSR